MIRFVLWLIVTLYTLAFLTACSDKQPARVAWISIEKSPIKVVYIDKQGKLDPVITSKMFHIVQNTPTRNIKINENTTVTVNANLHQSDVELDSDVTSASLSMGK